MQPPNTAGELVTVHQHNDFRNTVVVPNATAQDSSLSWAARGLLLHMLSMPENWQFHEHDLVNRSPMGRDHLRSIVRELEAAGYLRRTRRRDGNGRTLGTHWDVWPRPWTGNPSTGNPSMERTQSESGTSPLTEKPSTAAPLTEKPSPGNPSPENPPTYKRPNQQKPQSTNPFPPIPPTGGTPPAAALTDAGGRGKRTRRLDPATAALPAVLEPHRQAIADFWAAKRTGSARTSKAFELLVGQLERIHGVDPDAVAEQLNAATQAGWSSITFRNWERYGRREAQGSQLAYGGHGSRAQQNAAAAKELLAKWDREGGLVTSARDPKPALTEAKRWY